MVEGLLLPVIFIGGPPGLVSSENKSDNNTGAEIRQTGSLVSGSDHLPPHDRGHSISFHMQGKIVDCQAVVM
jgi:hypothetical protein